MCKCVSKYTLWFVQHMGNKQHKPPTSAKLELDPKPYYLAWRKGFLTISYQLHCNNAASGHEACEGVIKRSALMDSIELLCFTQRKLAHLHFAARAYRLLSTHVKAHA